MAANDNVDLIRLHRDGAIIMLYSLFLMLW